MLRPRPCLIERDGRDKRQIKAEDEAGPSSLLSFYLLFVEASWVMLMHAQSVGQLSRQGTSISF
jgi:hypothetical protein